MSLLRSVGLVARREILERGRSRGFILSVLFTTLLVVGSIFVPAILFPDDEITQIGVVQPVPAGLELAITTTAAQFGEDVEIIPYPDVAAGDAALAADDIEALAVVPEDLSSSGEVRLTKDLDSSIEGRDVIIVEDIVDTGLTLHYLQEILLARGPRSLRTACLLSKPSRRKIDVRVDYIGFTIEDRFVVGYGLDYAEQYRNLPYIGVLG